MPKKDNTKLLPSAGVPKGGQRPHLAKPKKKGPLTLSQLLERLKTADKGLAAQLIELIKILIQKNFAKAQPALKRYYKRYKRKTKANKLQQTTAPNSEFNKVVAAAQNSEQLDTFVRTLLLLNSRKGQAAIEGPGRTQFLLPDEKKSERKIEYSLLNGDVVSVDPKDVKALARTAAVIESKLDAAAEAKNKKVSEKRDKRITQLLAKKYGTIADKEAILTANKIPYVKPKSGSAVDYLDSILLKNLDEAKILASDKRISDIATADADGYDTTKAVKSLLDEIKGPAKKKRTPKPVYDPSVAATPTTPSPTPTSILSPANNSATPAPSDYSIPPSAHLTPNSTATIEDITSADTKTGRGLSSVPEDGLYTGQINHLLKDIPGFQGTFPRDANLPITNKNSSKNYSWVLNLDKHNEPGSHWVAVLLTDKSAEYCDSLGGACPVDILKQIIDKYTKLYNVTTVPFKENRIKMQSDDTSTCGIFAAMFIVNRNKGVSFEDATGFKQQRDDVKGEQAVAQFQKHFPKFKNLSQTGEGIKEWLQNVWDFFKGAREGGSPKVRKFLEDHGNEVITSMTVYRDPIKSIVQSVLNFLTAGALNNAKRMMNYDDVFHLYIQVDTPVTKSITIEKVAVVQVEANSKGSSGSTRKDFMVVPLNKEITIFNLFKNGKRMMGEASFWSYSAKNNNCQDFLMGLLQGSALGNDAIYKFVKQDAVSLFKYLPGFSERAADFATGAAARLDVLFHGRGAVSLKGSALVNIPNSQMMGEGMGIPTDPLANPFAGPRVGPPLQYRPPKPTFRLQDGGMFGPNQRTEYGDETKFTTQPINKKAKF